MGKPQGIKHPFRVPKTWSITGQWRGQCSPHHIQFCPFQPQPSGEAMGWGMGGSGLGGIIGGTGTCRIHAKFPIPEPDQPEWINVDFSQWYHCHRSKLIHCSCWGFPSGKGQMPSSSPKLPAECNVAHARAAASQHMGIHAGLVASHLKESTNAEINDKTAMKVHSFYIKCEHCLQI